MTVISGRPRVELPTRVIRITRLGADFAFTESRNAIASSYGVVSQKPVRSAREAGDGMGDGSTGTQRHAAARRGSVRTASPAMRKRSGESSGAGRFGVHPINEIAARNDASAAGDVLRLMLRRVLNNAALPIVRHRAGIVIAARSFTDSLE